MCTCVCARAHTLGVVYAECVRESYTHAGVHAGVLGGQRRASDPLELELPDVGSGN